MGVYGNLLSAFPELVRRIYVFSKEDRSDERLIKGVYMPTKGDRFVSQKITNRGKGIQYFSNDSLFVSRFWRDKVKPGDYFHSPLDNSLCRVVGMTDWQFEGGFTRFVTERVTGSTFEQTEELKVKEAEFA